MKNNPLLKLQDHGQSVWLDLLSRDMLVSGELNRLIQEDGLSAVTSNPAIFEKDMTESSAYNDRIRDLSLVGNADIYRIALDIAQVAPDCVAYVEDRAMFVDVAAGLGIRGIVHKTFESTRDALAAIGLVLDGFHPSGHR